MKKQLLFLVILCAFSLSLFAQANFNTSLHNTRNGKIYWYSKVENGGTGGFETLTNIPIDGLGCVQCHGASDANGNPYPDPFAAACNNCHKTDFSVEVSQCLSCHSRQAAEINVHNYSDVHRDAGMVCWDCHPSEDVHGDGTEYNSMLEDGAIKADCEECHGPSGSNPLPAGHAANDPHSGKIHCTSCHAQSVISCYNCHFESQLEHNKRPLKQIKNFMLLVNREKDGKVHPASFQSLSYQGNTWVAFGPYTPHNITREGRGCLDCHANMGGSIPAISDFNDDGIMQFAKWNEADSSLTTLTGIVPMPADYLRSFKIDFITYLGNTTDPVAPSKNWGFVESDWDGQQMFFCTPLTIEQMGKLGFNTDLVSVEDNIELPSEYSLEQNYPNPFNPSTTIKYSIPAEGYVSLKVFNSIGEVVETLVSQNQNAGSYQITFDASKLSSGIYLYQISSGNFVETKKLVLMK